MIILLNRCGQLGNRLFMFANFIALAQKHKLNIVNLAFFEYQRHFKDINQDLFCRYPQKRFKFVKHREVNYFLYLLFFHFFKFFKKINLFTKRLMILDLDKDGVKISPDHCNQNILWAAQNGIVVILHGWVDVFTKLNDQQNLAVKGHFVIKDEHKNKIDQLMLKLKKLGNIVVGVHIRHGDYKRFRGGKYFYSIAAYTNFMKQIQTFLSDKKVVFLVCSNESLMGHDFEGLTYVLGTGHRAEDLYALACCDYLIGPPSTYTMWASFWGQVPLYMIESMDHKFKLADFKVFCEM